MVFMVFTCVSYAEARNRYRLDVCPSVRLSVCLSACLSVCHTLLLYQNVVPGRTHCRGGQNVQKCAKMAAF